ncbi:MAG: hypothetical protein WCH40_06860 [Verrucomicrobiales bacterium]|jgi:hypothetical protein
MKAFHLFLVLAAATFVSCERHDFEETKKLSEHHGAHPEHAEGATGEHAEGAKDEHAPKGEH